MPDGRRVNHLPRGHANAPVFGRIVPENRTFQTSGIHDQIVQSQHQPPPPQSHQQAEPSGLTHDLSQLRMDDNGSREQALYLQNVTEWQEQRQRSPKPMRGSRDLGGEQVNGSGTTSSLGAQLSLRSQNAAARSPQSPPGRALGPLDAQLPASLDSNGLSWFARHGPVAASVPHTRGFGIPEQFQSHSTSPLPSVPVQPSTSLFTPNLGTSPRNTTLGRAMFERRHSAINDRLDDNELTFEEDFVPSSLNELLTPAERQRRDSRGAEDLPSKSPTGSASGSPSSSRFGQLFQKHKVAEATLRSSPASGPIMPIGSPLARSSSGAIGDNPLSPPRSNRNSSLLRTDMKASAKEFSSSRDKDFKNEEEPFEMDF